ncbi:hypothetical protein IWQ55_006641 [Labrenzia sp. EL_208]|nr:hypothetical protein [Labrenzia sp. EL_132]MBG6233399.1 hypothetical protein [Labrenzia sp. EL_208]
MPNLSHRLSKLEQRIAGVVGRPSRFVSLSYGRQSDEEIDQFLSEQGYKLGEDTMLIKRRIVEPGENGPIASDVPITLLSPHQASRHG